MRGHARQRGFTLVELVVTLVISTIVVAFVSLFISGPVRGFADQSRRVRLVDAADSALTRIGRDIRRSLPNSVRVTTSASSSFLEFIPVRAGGRYRAESSGAACGAGTDELAFDTVDTCFKTIGALPVQDVAAIAASDFLVLNNYGFPGQDAYQTAPPLNRRQIISVTNEGSPVAREVVAFASAGAFDRSLHDSPARRFYIVVGNAATGLPAPVTYECSPPTLIRRSGYTLTATQPTSFGDGTSALVADNVESCSFDYAANGIAAQVGLLTLHLQLAKTVSSGVPERISLYHAVHVNNVP